MNTNTHRENPRSQTNKARKTEQLTNLQEWIKQGLIAALLGLCLNWGFSSCEDGKGYGENYHIDGTEKFEVPENLQGKKYTNLHSLYLGKPIGTTVIFEDSFSRDKNKAMDALWHKKFETGMTNEDRARLEDFFNRAVKKTNFNDVKPSNLEQYENNIKNILKKKKAAMDRERLGAERLNGDSKKLKLLKKFSDMLDEKMLISYSMTELFPSEGESNKDFLDLLLNTAGEKYLDYIPSIWDKRISFWPFQFTEDALLEEGETINGASKTNLYLNSEEKIPKRLLELNGLQHHTAAYLFALENIISLLKKDDKLVMDALSYLSKKRNKADFIQLIALMHNYPKNGEIFLKERYRLNTDKNYYKKKTIELHYDYPHPYGEIPLYEVCPKGSKGIENSSEYARKTLANLKALYEEDEEE